MSIALPSIASGDLVQYVKTKDKVYNWKKIYQTDLNDGAVLYELELVSQVWHGISWHHTFCIIRPKAIHKNPTLAFLLISGSIKEEKELRTGEVIASKIGAPVAILYDIPNQPLFEGLMEDDLIAHTLEKFIETRDNTWPLLLPMVEGTVRAMDCFQEFMQLELDTHVCGFLISGASKRGWTTWLTPVVDKRVKAIAPVVFDNLNLQRQMRHQLEVWGEFSEEISEYTDRDLPQRLLSYEKAAEDLSSLLDPFTYRRQITIPKLIIIATNDRYWTLDALNLYYHELIGEKYIRYVPNAGHESGADLGGMIGDIIAFFKKTDGRLKYPKLSWLSKDKEGTIGITITSDIKPLTVRAWIATSRTKDFRDARWNEFEMEQENQIYTYKIQKPAGSYVAIFSEAVYTIDGNQFSLSTNVSIFR